MPRIEGTKIAVDAAGRDIVSPIVQVTVRTAIGIVTALAVIDSGADSTVVPVEFLTGLKVDFDKLPPGRQGQGAGGTFERRPMKATLKFREWVVCEEIEVAQAGALPVILLGRHDFFKRFNVRFSWHKDPPYVDVDPVDVGKRR